MIVLDKTVISPTEPPWTNVLWIKTIGTQVALYVFTEGSWNTLKLVNDMGTSDISDDTVVDVSNIPSIDNLEGMISGEVTSQIRDHDIAVRDVHNTDATDEDDYPDVTII